MCGGLVQLLSKHPRVVTVTRAAMKDVVALVTAGKQPAPGPIATQGGGGAGGGGKSPGAKGGNAKSGGSGGAAISSLKGQASGGGGKDKGGKDTKKDNNQKKEKVRLNVLNSSVPFIYSESCLALSHSTTYGPTKTEESAALRRWPAASCVGDRHRQPCDGTTRGRVF